MPKLRYGCGFAGIEAADGSSNAPRTLPSMVTIYPPPTPTGHQSRADRYGLGVAQTGRPSPFHRSPKLWSAASRQNCEPSGSSASLRSPIVLPFRGPVSRSLTFDDGCLIRISVVEGVTAAAYGADRIRCAPPHES